MVTRQLQVERRTGKVRRSKTNATNQHRAVLFDDNIALALVTSFVYHAGRNENLRKITNNEKKTNKHVITEKVQKCAKNLGYRIPEVNGGNLGRKYIQGGNGIDLLEDIFYNWSNTED